MQVALMGLAILTLAALLAGLAMVIVGGRTIPRLIGMRGEANGPKVSVIIAARDEAPHIEKALASLLTQDYTDFELIAVDDRSTDDTGRILDRMAATNPRLRVIHVTDLPDGWLGKCNAMQKAADVATGQWLLFTDADIVFAPDALARASAFVLDRQIDHLALGPELDSPGLLLTLVVNFFALGFLGFYRPWLAPDPKREEHIGIGAFNLVRAELYRSFGGHSKIRLRPDDDIKLGRLVKLAGGRQMLANGQGTIRVRWYSTVGELARGLRKNTFAGFNYNLPFAIGAMFMNLAVNIWPFAALFIVSGSLWWINAACALVLMAMYAVVAIGTGEKPWLAIGYPIAAIIFLYIMIAAVWYPVSRGGIEWRGTFYPLDALRRNVV